jgi:MarR family transcriptional regulator, organic hydroperoxide resistance regulator
MFNVLESSWFNGEPPTNQDDSFGVNRGSRYSPRATTASRTRSTFRSFRDGSHFPKRSRTRSQPPAQGIATHRESHLLFDDDRALIGFGGFKGGPDFLLQRAAHQLKTQADASLGAACGLTTSQAAALTVIAQRGTTNQKEVVHALAQRESAITTMAQRLLDAGFISREPSANDARAWQLDVTDVGRDALERVRSAFAPVNAVLDACFTSDHLATLANGLTKVLEPNHAPPEHHRMRVTRCP